MAEGGQRTKQPATLMPPGSDGAQDDFLDAARKIGDEALRLVREEGLSRREAFLKIAGELREPYRAYALDFVREWFG